jgi:hypothetical protein
VLTLDGEIVSCGTKDLLTDPLGSLVKEISSGASLGSLIEMYPYGTLVSGTGTPTIPYVYIAKYGYYFDNEQRDYVRARELYKANGRWMQVDPFWPHEIAFGYAHSGPCSFIDPFGTSSIMPGCPSWFDPVWDRLQHKLFIVWGQDVLGGPKWSGKIGKCIENASKSQGTKCDPFTATTLSCLKDKSLWALVRCGCCSNAKNCAETSNAGVITICINNWGVLDCGNYHPSLDHAPIGGNSDLWVTLLHEFLHTCGFHHGSSSGSGTVPSERCTCNEIAACCMWDIIFEGGDGGKCLRC